MEQRARHLPLMERHLERANNQPPREFGKPGSTWTLDLLAEVAFEEGLKGKSPTRPSGKPSSLCRPRFGEQLATRQKLDYQP